MSKLHPPVSQEQGMLGGKARKFCPCRAKKLKQNFKAFFLGEKRALMGTGLCSPIVREGRKVAFPPLPFF